MRKQVIILEEDRDDWSLVKETLNELSLDVPLQFFSGSIDLFNYLQVSPKPSLILVDYNSLPDSGLEVLKRIKSHPIWKEIPVVVLSDSDDEVYRAECYRHGANSFIKKPDTAEGTRNKIGTFFKYWFDVAEV